LAKKAGKPDFNSAAVLALCRGAALNSLGRKVEARQCFEWIVARSSKITEDR